MPDPSFTLFLARHGETEHNRLRLMQGRSIDAHLNETGLRQAGLLSERFATVPLSAVYASGLKRAQQTAAVVARPHGLEVRTLDLVAEMYWGSLEGQSIDAVGPYLKRIGQAWKAGDFGHRVGGGETILEVQERSVRALDQLRASHGDGEQILVVTHGRFLRVMLATALAGSGLEDMDEFGHANTGIYRLDWGRDGFTLGLRNDTEHLTSMEAATR